MEPWTLLLCFWTLTLSVMYLIDSREAVGLRNAVRDARRELSGLRQSKWRGWGGLAAGKERDNQRLVKAADRMHAEIRKLQSADFYWEVGEEDSASFDIWDFLDQRDLGDVVRIQPVHELPEISVERTEDGYRILTNEEVEKLKDEE